MLRGAFKDSCCFFVLQWLVRGLDSLLRGSGVVRTLFRVLLPLGVNSIVGRTQTQAPKALARENKYVTHPSLFRRLGFYRGWLLPRGLAVVSQSHA